MGSSCRFFPVFARVTRTGTSPSFGSLTDEGTVAQLRPNRLYSGDGIPFMEPFDVFSMGVEDTEKIATELAPFLSTGDVVLLSGGLASGKTHFVKALAKAMGSGGSVTSPTYGIANFYPLPAGNLLHLDVYRLSGIPEFRDLGLEEYFGESVTVVEWGERVAREFRENLTLSFSFVESNENHREITVAGTGRRWQDALPRLRLRLEGISR